MRKINIVLKNGTVNVDTEIPDLDALDLPAIFLCTNEEYKHYLDDRNFIGQVMKRWEQEAVDTAQTINLSATEKQEAIVAYGLPANATDEQINLSVAKGTNFSNYLLRRISDDRFQSQFARALAKSFPTLIRADLVRVTPINEGHYLFALNMDLGDISILVARLMTIAYTDQPVVTEPVEEVIPEPQKIVPAPQREVTLPSVQKAIETGYYAQEPISPTQVLTYRPVADRAIVLSNQNDPFTDD